MTGNRVVNLTVRGFGVWTLLMGIGTMISEAIEAFSFFLGIEIAAPSGTKTKKKKRIR